jgi:integrase
MSYPNFYRRIWVPSVERAGLKGLHLHDLRKAFASHMASSGHTPSYIEDVMGHASYSTTMKYYTMTSDTEADQARGQLEDWIGREENHEMNAA